VNIFSNRLALITGGSSGIGLALARDLSHRGSNIWIVGRREDLLKKALDIIENERINPQQKFGIIRADVTIPDQIFPQLEDFCSKVGTPDFLINSAGIVQPGEFINLSLDDFYAMMNTNYFGTVHCCRSIIPQMIHRSSGHIVNISSLAGVIGLYGYSGYSASKFAVRGFSDVLRSELKSHDIQVSVVYPPDTQTPQLDYDNLHKPAITKQMSSSGGLLTPEQVASAIIRGIERKKYVITPGFEASLIYGIQGFTGNLVYKIIDIMTAQAQQKIKKGHP